ncbi:MAG: 2-dehydropantoate 2-reductase [Candidatus Auribacterota bacterium]
MKILIYGAGAVGLGLASCLIEAGIQPVIIARPDTVHAVNQNGIQRIGIFGNRNHNPLTFRCFTDLELLQDEKFDFVFICTKAFDTQKAVIELSQHSIMKRDTKLILFQNGWGNDEICVQYFGDKAVFNGRVITGFRRTDRHIVDITVHADAIHLGSLFHNHLAPLESLAHTITAGGIPCIAVNDIAKDLWSKMLYNCALNPLGALFRVPYGKLGEYEESRSLMECIIYETFLTMRKAGYSTHWPDVERYIEIFYEKLLPPTATHESSMLQDLRAHKRTEIDALTGAVIKLARQYNVQVPLSETIYSMIMFIEKVHSTSR